jgi:hypothetical protein
VVTTNAADAWPSFRHDGSALLFTRTEEDGSMDVREVPIAGGEARVVVPAPARRAVASPVDERILFLAGADAQKLTPMIVRAHTTGSPTALSPYLPPARYGALQFSPDGKKVAIVRAGRQLVEVDAATGAALRAVHLDDQVTRVAYANERLVVVRRAWRGDLWMADLAP